MEEKNKREAKKKIKSFRLDNEALKILEELKNKLNKSEGEIVELALKEYFEKQSTFMYKLKKNVEIYVYVFLFFVLMVISTITGCFLYDFVK